MCRYVLLWECAQSDRQVGDPGETTVTQPADSTQSLKRFHRSDKGSINMCSVFIHCADSLILLSPFCLTSLFSFYFMKKEEDTAEEKSLLQYIVFSVTFMCLKNCQRQAKFSDDDALMISVLLEGFPHRPPDVIRSLEPHSVDVSRQRGARCADTAGTNHRDRFPRLNCSAVFIYF